MDVYPVHPPVLQDLLDVYPVPPPVILVSLAVYPVPRLVFQVPLDVYPVSCPVVEKMGIGEPWSGWCTLVWSSDGHTDNEKNKQTQLN